MARAGQHGFVEDADGNHTLQNGALAVQGAITSTGAVNAATLADLTKLHAVTASAAEVNKLTGNAATAADLTKLNAITATAAEVNTVADADSFGADGLTGALRVARITFDPSATPGLRTTGAHVSAFQLPAHAIIVGGFYDVNTAFTSANGNNGTISIGVESGVDIVAATVVSNAIYGTIGRKAILPKANTPENAVCPKTTAAQYCTFTVAVSDLTAGKLTLFLFYVVSVASA